MEPLSEEFVEKTWQEVAGFSPDRANKEMLAMGKSQPDLLAFLMAFTEDLEQDVKELCIYIAFVVYRMFLGSGEKIPRISSRKIMAAYNENARMLEGLEGAREKRIDTAANAGLSGQPHVMKYVLEALMEESEEDDSELSEEDIGLLFVLLKTETDVLDGKP